MKTISKIGAQGDVIFRRVDKLPSGCTEKKERIVAHSETGHNHVATGGRYFQKDDMLSYLVCTGPVQVEHHRDFDTHETIELRGEGPEIIWEIRRQREHTPEGWRRIED